MYGLLVALSIIISLLLIIMVLLQASKGDGLAGIAGGSGNIGGMFGARRTADFLSKATWWLGSALLILAVVINLFFLPGQSTSTERQSIIQSSTQQNQVPTTPALPTQTGTDSNSAN